MIFTTNAADLEELADSLITFDIHDAKRVTLENDGVVDQYEQVLAEQMTRETTTSSSGIELNNMLRSRTNGSDHDPTMYDPAEHVHPSPSDRTRTLEQIEGFEQL